MTFFVTLLLAFAAIQACPDEKYCVSCPAAQPGQDRLCASCENSFLNVDKKICDTTITAKVDNCKSYSKVGDDLKCAVCEKGFYIDVATNACTKCTVDNCAICNKEAMCFGCFNQMKLNRDQNTCDATAKCDVPNCDICISNNGVVTCAYCQNKFALSDPAQGACAAAPDNCFLLDDADNKKCGYCNYGYYITADGTCKSDVSSSWWWLWLILILAVLAVIGFIVYNQFQKNRDAQDIYNTA